MGDLCYTLSAMQFIHKVKQMQLTDDEKSALDGALGEPLRIATQVLVELGDSYGAERLVPIASAHLVACSYQIAGEAGIDIYSRLVEAGARVKVPTTLDPGSIDFVRWQAFRTPEGYAQRQLKIAGLLEAMGVIPTWTCTPYYVLNVPRFGQHIGWSESSAVAFVNSVIGARTNRLAAYVDLCAALTGKVPYFGLHITENRRGQILIDVTPDVGANMRDEDFAALGYFIGAAVGDRIPVIRGIADASFDQLKFLSAASASTGSVALYHIVGVTPEARTLQEAFQGEDNVRRLGWEDILPFGPRELQETKDKMCTFHEGQVDIVGLGCPHASIAQIEMYVRLLGDRKVHPDTELWICMNELVEGMARKMGYIARLEAAGARIMTGTCLNDCPLEAWGFRHLATDSPKFAYYTPTTVGAECYFASTEKCIQAAIAGRI